MDKSKIRKYQIFSIIFVFILGTLLHFTYNLFGANSIVAAFSAINESVWEHLKLVFFPMLLSLVFGYFYIGKNIPNFICSKTFGILTAIFFMFTFFYTYSGVIGNNIAIIDIASFFVSVMLGEFASYVLIINNFKCTKQAGIVVLIILLISFIVFTFATPNLGIFKDPVTGLYGINK